MALKVEESNNIIIFLLGAYIVLDDNDNEITLYVGISYISIDQAKINLMKETNNCASSFEEIKTLVQNDWEF